MSARKNIFLYNSVISEINLFFVLQYYEGVLSDCDMRLINLIFHSSKMKYEDNNLITFLAAIDG